MRSKKYIYANLHKIIRFYVVHNKITTIYNKKRGFPFYWKTSLLCRGDRIRTCDHLFPKQERYRAALHPVYILFSSSCTQYQLHFRFAVAKVVLFFDSTKFFINFFPKMPQKRTSKQSLTGATAPYTQQLYDLQNILVVSY